MLDSFTPDYIFDSIFDIDTELFTRCNIKGLILDIDNTLVSYSEPEPTAEVKSWLESLVSRGIQCAFISNNKQERVERFNRQMGFFAAARAGKPSTRAIKRAMVHFGLDRSEVALIGDQVFTDVLAARRARLMVILVNPIDGREGLLFSIKRLGEKPFRSRYFRRLKKMATQEGTPRDK